ncbi:MarR family transcriptional regulator [Nocardia sp. R6R-6]|uniref:MarR family transcriptional regulator n=1 Tax=Nocardia sp. R6R-6 TaxID=3459303 RepID=UPI00403DC859
MTSTSPKSTPSLLYSVKRLELAIRSHLDEMLRGSGITTLQYTALTVLAHRDGISAAQLARDSFVTPQSMADMVRALEQRELIHRTPNPDSKRELLVYITESGRGLLRDYAAAADTIEERMAAALPAGQVEAFRTALGIAWSALRRQ